MSIYYTLIIVYRINSIGDNWYTILFQIPNTKLMSFKKVFFIIHKLFFLSLSQKNLNM